MEGLETKVTPKEITPSYTASAQIGLEDLKEIADLGFKAVINNRPDNEEAGQPLDADLRAAAESLGLSYHSIPMTMPSLTPELVAQHHAAIRDTDGKVFAFCRSGTRSTVLWALTRVCFEGASNGEVVSAAGAQGYDLSGMHPLLDGFREALSGS